MPRSFDMATDYDGSVEHVHRAFGDERYWLARLADSGADETTLDALTVTGDGGIDVVTTQILRADRLPGLVSQFHRGDLRIRREERWQPIRDGLADGTVEGSIPGAPVSLSGTAKLATTDSGSRLTVHITVEVRVPLVGGKIESFIGRQLVDLLTAEQRFTSVWISDHA
ncbi:MULTISPECIES: DUF2505 domain-containing protein [unclassified Mycolicibacterium]|uniref:DUF2505 domain-containing protein n=1 Tax=unclassified Mycolicibacterium TaxID=2636767 RepID=UPI0012DD5692|nr:MULTISPECIES: DUF2505 domain-containing protein [unclassified Mycolicibacterium]MUL81757.1 DUF2505 domain-containing protein [Mycolicibacterium sp. CBMA 329]MUL87523.1 DUF2505 domain-containing protein [Mycolicibacterium sp. CBMA 331]MUL99613.1 DUF2505 domain-containing protein [Mycolicibacterium sp. CBMA 334]MUM37820.1 DUF2505 domain-containing protein [Mycolicibacterium sp. CBMA 247]MUM43588.1 DUF2505 domain-containing protein [Mycolicibacterium sp. CBMA 294]